LQCIEDKVYIAVSLQFDLSFTELSAFLFLIFFFISSSFRLKLFSDFWEGLISFPATRIQSEAEMKLKNFEEFVKIM